MDLINDMDARWLILVLLAVCGAMAGVIKAFTRCAIADITVHLAAWLYSTNPEARAEHLEEWRREIEEMAPAERPSHAGSLLWLVVRMSPRALARWSGEPRSSARTRRLVVSVVAGAMSGLAVAMIAVGLPIPSALRSAPAIVSGLSVLFSMQAVKRISMPPTAADEGDQPNK